MQFRPNRCKYKFPPEWLEEASTAQMQCGKLVRPVLNSGISHGMFYKWIHTNQNYLSLFSYFIILWKNKAWGMIKLFRSLRGEQ